MAEPLQLLWVYRRHRGHPNVGTGFQRVPVLVAEELLAAGCAQDAATTDNKQLHHITEGSVARKPAPKKKVTPRYKRRDMRPENGDD